MHAGKHYTFREVLYWTRREIYVLVVLGAIPTTLHEVWDIRLTLPWVPIALIGTAVAFIVGFKKGLVDSTCLAFLSIGNQVP